MAPKKKAKKKKAEAKAEEHFCPVCLLIETIRDATDRKSPFVKHMQKARIEFLEGLKCLIDERIERAKKTAGKKKSRLTKIKVED